MNQEDIGTHQKALRINLDQTKYGTFAEIGAGQEDPDTGGHGSATKHVFALQCHRVVNAPV